MPSITASRSTTAVAGGYAAEFDEDRLAVDLDHLLDSSDDDVASTSPADHHHHHQAQALRQIPPPHAATTATRPPVFRDANRDDSSSASSDDNDRDDAAARSTAGSHRSDARSSSPDDSYGQSALEHGGTVISGPRISASAPIAVVAATGGSAGSSPSRTAQQQQQQQHAGSGAKHLVPFRFDPSINTLSDDGDSGNLEELEALSAQNDDDDQSYHGGTTDGETDDEVESDDGASSCASTRSSGTTSGSSPQMRHGHHGPLRSFSGQLAAQHQQHQSHHIAHESSANGCVATTMSDDDVDDDSGDCASSDCNDGDDMCLTDSGSDDDLGGSGHGGRAATAGSLSTCSVTTTGACGSSSSSGFATSPALHPFLDLELQQRQAEWERSQLRASYHAEMQRVVTLGSEDRAKALQCLMHEAHRFHETRLAARGASHISSDTWRDLASAAQAELESYNAPNVQRNLSCMCIFSGTSGAREYGDHEEERSRRQANQHRTLHALRMQAASGGNPYFLAARPANLL